MKLLTSIDDIVMELSSVYSAGLGNISVLNTIKKENLYSLDHWSKDVINSIATQMLASQYITQKQGNLVLKVIRRYRKQLYKNGFDVKDLVKEPYFKHQFRQVDYNKKIFIDNDSLHIQFPYNDDWIRHIKSKRSDYRGKVIFNSKKKLWEFDLLEDFFDLDIIQLFLDDGFELCDESAKILEKCNEIRDHENLYLPMLDYKSGELVFCNCEDELIEHFTKNVGLLNQQELSRIVDKCSDYGMSVGVHLEKLFVEKYGNIVTKNIYLNKTTRIRADKVNILNLVNYIKSSGRKPVYILISGNHTFSSSESNKWLKEKKINSEDNYLGFNEVDYFYEMMKKHSLKIIRCDGDLASYSAKRYHRRHHDHHYSAIPLDADIDADIIILDHYPASLASELLITTRDPEILINNNLDHAKKIVYYY